MTVLEVCAGGSAKVGLELLLLLPYHLDVPVGFFELLPGELLVELGVPLLVELGSVQLLVELGVVVLWRQLCNNLPVGFRFIYLGEEEVSGILKDS
jgi:hypothetical protein